MMLRGISNQIMNISKNGCLPNEFSLKLEHFPEILEIMPTWPYFISQNGNDETYTSFNEIRPYTTKILMLKVIKTYR